MAFWLLLIDSINGAFLLIYNIDIKISILYKLSFLLIGCIYLSKVNFDLFLISVSLVIYFFIWALLQNLVNPLAYFMKDFGEGVKLITLIIVYNVFSCFSETDCKKFLLRFVVISSSIVLINIIMSLLGFGVSAYSNFGAKGFFYAGNALSGVLVIFSTFIMAYYYNASWVKFSLSFVLLLVFSFIIGTKSGVLGVFLSFVFITIYHSKISIFSIIKIFILLSMLALSISFTFDYLLKTEFFIRIMHFYDTGGLVRGLLSDRDISFFKIYGYFINSNITTLLFGFGFSDLHNIVGDNGVEMDFVDIVFLFGLFTAFVYFILLFFTLFISQHRVTKNDRIVNLIKCVLVVSSSILILIAFVAGHILYNGNVVLLWGIVLALPRWRQRNINS
jgi:hypothetical protein